MGLLSLLECDLGNLVAKQESKPTSRLGAHIACLPSGDLEVRISVTAIFSFLHKVCSQFVWFNFHWYHANLDVPKALNEFYWPKPVDVRVE